MGKIDETKGGERQGSKGTLGDVLYAAKSGSYVSEKDWVALVQSIAASDERALQALYERTHRIVYTLIARITGSRHMAEEVTLDVFYDVWRRASGYDPANGTVLGWIMNQARSRAIDRVRYEQRKKRTDPHPDAAATDEVAAGPDQAVEFRQQGRVLRDALAALTAHEREAIEAAFFSGLTHAETAVHLSQPLGTVKTRIRSGLTKLRESLTGKL